MYGPTTITTKGQVTIPEEVRLLLNAQPGDKALFSPIPQKKRIVIDIIPTKNVVDRLYGSLKSKVPYAPQKVVREKVGLALAKELGLTK